MVFTNSQSSALLWRFMEGSCRTPGPVPIQKPKHWLRESDLPSEYRRAVGYLIPHSIVSTLRLLRSGSVCLDVINQTWSPMFDMINIFEVFLPQLLRYPNPTDPLNGEAAALLMREPKSYEVKVKGEQSAQAYQSRSES